MTRKSPANIPVSLQNEKVLHTFRWREWIARTLHWRPSNWATLHINQNCETSLPHWRMVGKWKWKWKGISFGLGYERNCALQSCLCVSVCERVNWTDCWPKLCQGSALIKSLNSDVDCNAISLTVACNAVASAIYQRVFVARDFCVASSDIKGNYVRSSASLYHNICASHQKVMQTQQQQQQEHQQNRKIIKKKLSVKMRTMHSLLLLLRSFFVAATDVHNGILI